MSSIKVALVGATGETGTSIVNGLLESLTTKFVRIYHFTNSHLGTRIGLLTIATARKSQH